MQEPEGVIKELDKFAQADLIKTDFAQNLGQASNDHKDISVPEGYSGITALLVQSKLKQIQKKRLVQYDFLF